MNRYKEIEELLEVSKKILEGISEVLKCIPKADPRNIFDEKYLLEWVRNFCLVSEVFDDNSIKKYVEETFTPDQVFTEDGLFTWIRNNYDVSDVFGTDEVFAWLKRNYTDDELLNELS